MDSLRSAGNATIATSSREITSSMNQLLYVLVQLRNFKTRALIDSGCMQNFISLGLARKANITLIDILNKYGVTMINGMRVQTKVKQETKYVNLKIGTHEEMIHFNIMPLDPYELVLGIPWLRKHNPEVD